MNKTIYVCDNCGNESIKWAGKCPVCQQWNTLKQISIAETKTGSRSGILEVKPEKLSQVKEFSGNRLQAGISEVDLVFGGGLMPGSVVLLGGEPGIGKSTLILQIADRLQQKIGKDILYVSGEESLSQIKNRAQRLNIKSEIRLLASTDTETVISAAVKLKPAAVIIDSIQSMSDAQVESSPGSISQVKAVGLVMQKFAKENNIPVILIGHITKNGVVAGPKTLEHMVDAVAYLEGERFHTLRILRCTKNRFGSVNEVGIFEMTGAGLRQVKNASEEMLSQRKADLPGSAVTVILEGTRPFLIEVQALVSKSYLGFPQRKSLGFDQNRLQLLLAVLSARINLPVASFDIYLNIVGGLKTKDPAADLAVCVAVASAIKNKAIRKDLILLGEVGLGSDLRSVTNLARRIKEAQALGFKRVIVPKSPGKTLTTKEKSFKIIEARDLRDAIQNSLV